MPDLRDAALNKLAEHYGLSDDDEDYRQKLASALASEGAAMFARLGFAAAKGKLEMAGGGTIHFTITLETT